MKTKSEIINNIISLKEKALNYIYPDCPEAQVFSKQYYNTILSTIYNNSDSTFSLIYGDVNKLSEVNRLGKDIGDKSLLRLLVDIKSALPPDASITRLGGDEISILIPHCVVQFAQLTEKKIHSKLNSDKNNLHNLTISLSSADSKSGHVKDLEKITDANVEAQKHQRDNFTLKTDSHSEEFLPLSIPDTNNLESKNSWIVLNNLIDTAVDNHLSDTRPSDNREYTTEDIKNESFMLVNAFNNMLKNYNTETYDYEPVSYNLPDGYSLSDIPSIFKNPKICNLVHDTVLNKSNLNSENLSEEDLTNLDLAFNELVNTVLTKDSLSGLLNKASLKYDLSDKLVKSKSNYQAIFFSISGIKCSNTACGHDFTDMRIKETSKLLIDALNKKSSYNNDAFSFNESDNFLLDRGGGNFLALISDENNISKDDISSIVSDINSRYNPNDISSSFLVSAASSDDYMENGIIKKGSVKELFDSIKTLKNECNKNKDSLKKISICDITNLTAFEHRISNPIKFYFENISLSSEEDIANQKMFLSNLFTSLINNEYYHNKYEKINKKDIDDEFELT